MSGLDVGAPQVSDFGEFVSLSSLPSRAPEGLRAATRDELYYTAVWDSVRDASWEGAHLTRFEMEHEGFSPIKRVRKMMERDPVTELWTSAAMHHYAVVSMWNCLNAQQMAAMTGYATWARMRSGAVPDSAQQLWAHGLIESGKMPYRRPLPSAVRLGPSKHFSAVSDALSMSQWLSVTGGVPPRRTTGSTRHDMLAAELALRVAEYCDISSVIGESLGLLSHVTNTEGGGFRRADAVAVRPDGLKICFEMTGHPGGVMEKIDNYVEALSRCVDRSTAVVFVNASRAPKRTVAFNGRRVRMAIAKRVLEDPAARAARLSERMFFVDWSDWFGMNSIISDFAMLPVWRMDKSMTKPSSDLNGPWRRLNIGDVDATPWAPGSDESINRTARLISGAHTLWGVPSFLRDASLDLEVETRLNSTIVRDAGFTEHPKRHFHESRTRPDGSRRPSDEELAPAWAPGHIRLPKIAPRVAQN